MTRIPIHRPSSNAHVSPMEGGPLRDASPALRRGPSEIPGRGSFSVKLGRADEQPHPLRRADRNAGLKRSSQSSPPVLERPRRAGAERARANVDKPPPSSKQSGRAPPSWVARLGACLARLGLYNPGGSKLEGCRRALDATIDSLSWLSKEDKADYKENYAGDRDGKEMKACVNALQRHGRRVLEQKKQSLNEQGQKATKLTDNLRTVSDQLNSTPRNPGLLRQRNGLTQKTRQLLLESRQTKAELNMVALGLKTLNLLNLQLQAVASDPRGGIALANWPK